MTIDISAESAFAQKDAHQTLTRARDMIGVLLDDANESMSMAPRQRSELARFTTVFCDELKRYCELLEKSPSPINLQLLTTRQMELEEATRFIDRAFLQPRRQGQEIQILEAADWMCVEGFNAFVPESETQPIGPMVAIDSALTPAVWAPDAKLPIPSLFKLIPKSVERDEFLAPFPLICLPGHLTRSPEYLPLLSHEVGHTVDFHRKFTAQIVQLLQQIPETKYLDFWKAWMREMVADYVGLTLSGDAFLEALKRYLDQLTPLSEVSSANAYPANVLRLAFLGQIAKQYDENWTDDGACVPSDEQLRALSKTAKLLVDEFARIVLPAMSTIVRANDLDWPAERVSVSNFASQLIPDKELRWSLKPFRLMPSVIAIAQRMEGSQKRPFDTYDTFRRLHGSIQDKPTWIQGKTNWKFSEEYLPSLRPTLLGTDGKFKVPPVVLMTTHRKIAFVGATNWQLSDKLAEAFEAKKNAPWDLLQFFFASDNLLKQVEYGKGVDPIHDRDKSRFDIEQALRTKNWACRWQIFEFDGPPVFASYWDWNERGGRVHISPALLGTVIGECPATDQIWNQEFQTQEYKKYVRHLDCLITSSKSISLAS